MEETCPEKYEEVLSKIDDEFKEYNELKSEIAKLTNKLQVLKILNNHKITRENLFQVIVKIFQKVTDIYDIFPNSLTTNDLNDFEKRDVEYYHIEIFISQMFHEKLLTSHWLFTITVKNATTSTSRTINVVNRLSNPITVIIPFAKSENSTVDVTLLSPNEDAFWPSINLISLPIDVAYKFQNQTAKTFDPIYKINKLYNPQTPKPQQKLFQYKFKCNWNFEKFMEVVLKRSYHSLDLVKMFNKSNEVATVNLAVNGLKCRLELNFANKLLLIEANAKNMFDIKEYLFRNSDGYVQENFEALKFVVLKKEIRGEMESGRIDIHNLFNIYDKYVNCAAALPL